MGETARQLTAPFHSAHDSLTRPGLRPRSTVAAVLLAAVAALPLSGGAAQAADCEQIYREAQQAEGDGSRLATLHRQALHEARCDRAFNVALGRKAAIAKFLDIVERVDGGEPPERVEADLEASLTYARLWQALDFLGDIAREREAYALASRRYQEALSAMDDGEVTTQPPAPEAIAAIFKKAESSRLLADEVVPTPINRAGEPVGLGDADVRGWKPEKVAVPITFEFDSTVFTAKGRAAADDLFEQLKGQGSPNIVLVGHTDPRGTPRYNEELSLRRAEAVRAYLMQRGYGGRVEVAGVGERQPFEPDDPTRYDEEERHQMDRRVELRK